MLHYSLFKFRLKNSGIQNPIYLVEDYGSTQNLSIPEDTLLQAIANTQVCATLCALGFSWNCCEETFHLPF